ncbi:hypothetical protein [Sulfurisphaera javensis]
MILKSKSKKVELPLYDLAKLPDEYLKNEFPSYYNSIRKRKMEDPLIYLM